MEGSKEGLEVTTTFVSLLPCLSDGGSVLLSKNSNASTIKFEFDRISRFVPSEGDKGEAVVDKKEKIEMAKIDLSL